jgi:hypothetical protein
MQFRQNKCPQLSITFTLGSEVSRQIAHSGKVGRASSDVAGKEDCGVTCVICTASSNSLVSSMDSICAFGERTSIKDTELIGPTVRFDKLYKDH